MTHVTCIVNGRTAVVPRDISSGVGDEVVLLAGQTVVDVKGGGTVFRFVPGRKGDC